MTPEGWTRALILEACDKVGRVPTVPRSQYKPGGKLPVVDQGQGTIAGYSDDMADRYPGTLPVFVFGDHTRLWKYIDFDFAVGADGTQLLRARSLHDQRFVFHALSAAPIKNLGYSRHFKLLRELSILLPPLPEQKKIAAILSSVDDAIEATQAVIDQLQVVKKAMMAELLTRGLPGRHTRFKMTEIGEIPEEWEVVRMHEVVEEGTAITYGIVQAGPHVDKGVPYIRTGDVKPTGIISSDLLGRTSTEIASKFLRSRVRAGDLVICIRASVGAVARVPGDLDGANLTQGTARIAPGPRVSGEYLLWALRSQALQEWVGLRCKGSTFREITLGHLRLLPVPIPTMAEQVAVAEALGSLEARIRSEEEGRVSQKLLKSALLSVLLTGEVRVIPDEATP